MVRIRPWTTGGTAITDTSSLPLLGNPAMMRNEQGAGQDNHHLRAFRRRAAEWSGHVVGRIFDFKHVGCILSNLAARNCRRR
jgi:hypothetical protein